MPTLRGVKVDIAVSDAILPAYVDPDPDQEPDTISSYVEAMSDRWFAVFVRVPHHHRPRGDVFIVKVFLDGRMIAEAWRQPGEQLPLSRKPEGEAGFEGDIVPAYEPILASGLWETEGQRRAREEAGRWLMQGRIDGMAMRFPHVVTDSNPHAPGDVSEWEGKEIVVQFSEGSVLEAPSEDAWGNHAPGKVDTVGDVLAFTFKHRPQKILSAILGHSTQSRPSPRQIAHDTKSPDRGKTVRPFPGKDRANSIDSNATVRPNMPAAVGTSRNDTRKPVWNDKTYQVEWLTETGYTRRMHNPRALHPADEQWRSNVANFHSEWMYCCKRMRPDSKFVWCDNKGCEIGVFHFWCVGLTSEPHWGGRLWLCPICRELPEQEVKIRSGREDGI